MSGRSLIHTRTVSRRLVCLERPRCHQRKDSAETPLTSTLGAGQNRYCYGAHSQMRPKYCAPTNERRMILQHTGAFARACMHAWCSCAYVRMRLRSEIHVYRHPAQKSQAQVLATCSCERFQHRRLCRALATSEACRWRGAS